MRLRITIKTLWFERVFNNSQRRRWAVRKGPLLILLGMYLALGNAYAETSQEENNIRMSDSKMTQQRHWTEKQEISRSATVYSGSLKENLSRIAKNYGWKEVVWLVDTDYQWVGQVTIQEKNIYSLLTRILKNYPLQAVFYEGNHVLVITPRNV
jgi:hypothetical protein